MRAPPVLGCAYVLVLYLTTTLTLCQHLLRIPRLAAPDLLAGHETVTRISALFRRRSFHEAAPERCPPRRRRPDRLCARLSRRFRGDARCRPADQSAPAGDQRGTADAQRRCD